MILSEKISRKFYLGKKRQDLLITDFWSRIKDARKSSEENSFSILQTLNYDVQDVRQIRTDVTKTLPLRRYKVVCYAHIKNVHKKISIRVRGTCFDCSNLSRHLESHFPHQYKTQKQQNGWEKTRNQISGAESQSRSSGKIGASKDLSPRRC